MEVWAAATNALCYCDGVISYCPSFWPKATYPECHTGHFGNDMIPRDLFKSPYIYNLMEDPAKPQIQDVL